MTGGNWKIERLSNFWKLQKLSIVGRILVSKTYLMAQATFLLGVLPLEKEVGDRINELMATFIKGNDRVIAKERWCIARELGGYGMVDMHVMNTCIKASWINRWIKNVESVDINGKRSGAEMGKPVDQWGEGRFGNQDRYTKQILVEWKNYKRMFYGTGGNIGRARLMENDGILEGKRNLGVDIFGRNRYQTLSVRVKLLRVGDFVSDGRVKDKVRIERELGMQLNMAE